MTDTNKECQSCAMPMHQSEHFGTESNGEASADYCCHCYKAGKFTDNWTLEEAARFNIQFWKCNGETDEQAYANIMECFPKLKRWAK